MTKIFVEGRADGPTNMARDVALWEDSELGLSQVRIYEWSDRWISLGKYQARIECPVPQVVRPTGGRAVLHGDDITIAWAVPLSTLGLTTLQIRRIYGVLMEPIVRAVTDCGLPVQIGSDSPDQGPKIDCFQASSRFDLCVGSTKVGGAALATNRYGALLQVSILCRDSVGVGPFAARSVEPWRFLDLSNALTCYIPS